MTKRSPFLQGEPLADDEEERYAQYAPTGETFTLYEHCRRALRKGTTAGRHGIPLMGGGDWNDGMNRVGIEGKGESIWLGWFLHATLTTFAALCMDRGDEAQACTLSTAGGGSGRRAGSQRLGRRLVSSRLLRRRHTAWFCTKQ